MWNGIWNGTEQCIPYFHFVSILSRYKRRATQLNTTHSLLPSFSWLLSLFWLHRFLILVIFFLFFFYIFYILLFAHAVDAVKEATIVGVLLGLVALGVLTLFLMHHCCHKKKPKLRSNDIEQATETSIELQKNPMNNSSD